MPGDPNLGGGAPQDDDSGGGLKAFTYLAGDGRKRDLGFKLFFCLFVVAGASLDLGALVNLSDALVFVVAIPNLLGLYVMAPLVKRELAGYGPFRSGT